MSVVVSDAYDFLAGLASDHGLGYIDLVVTDPPFNTGRDFREYDDSWSDEKVDFWHHYTNLHAEARAVIDVARSIKGEPMSAYLCYMGGVFQAARAMLKPTGSLYVHCDDKSSHYLKLLLDAIFGEKQFLNDLVWKRSEGMNQARRFIRITDNILLYAKKAGDHYFNPEATITPLPKDKLEVKFPFKDARGRYALRMAVAPPSPYPSTGETAKPWRHYDPAAAGFRWAVPRRGSIARWIDSVIPGFLDEPDFAKRLDMLDGADMLYHPPKGKIVKYKYYADAFTGVVARNLLLEPSGFTCFNSVGVRHGYPTEKPVPLYELFITASSREGDLVVDPFAGSGTTLVAAKRLGRRFAGSDINPTAVDIANRRLSEFLI